MLIKRILKLASVIAIVGVSMLKAQTTDSLNFGSSKFKINIHTGLEFNELGNLKSSFIVIRDYIRYGGIKIPDQLVSPRSNSFGASVLFSLKGRMYFGARFEHSSSKAYLVYKDDIGTVDLNSSLTSDKFFITGQYVLPYHKYFSPLAEMNLGLLVAKYKFTNKIRFYRPFFESLDERSYGKKNTHIISLFLGAQNNVYKNIVLFEKLGYQFSVLAACR